MKASSHESAVFRGSDLALSTDADAARVADDLAHHVLGRVRAQVAVIAQEAPVAAAAVDVADVSLSPANWPLGNVVRPDVRGHTGGSLTVTAKKKTFKRKEIRGTQRHRY